MSSLLSVCGLIFILLSFFVSSSFVDSIILPPLSKLFLILIFSFSFSFSFILSFCSLIISFSLLSLLSLSSLIFLFSLLLSKLLFPSLVFSSIMISLLFLLSSLFNKSSTSKGSYPIIFNCLLNSKILFLYIFTFIFDSSINEWNNIILELTLCKGSFSSFFNLL